jgi:heme exporter protein D
MGKRILLAGVLGGVAMFVWASIAHMVLPLGYAGVHEIPNETAVLGAMQSTLGQNAGLYIFPALGAGPNATAAQRNAAMKDYAPKLAANPSGLLIYHPPGANGITGKRLGTEFVTELVETLLAVFLLAQTRIGSYAGKVGFMVVVGVVAAITTNIPYWNWYGFPGNYTEAYMFTQVVAFLAAGLVAAAVVKNREPLGFAASAK